MNRYRVTDWVGDAPEDIDQRLPFCGCSWGPGHFDNLVRWLRACAGDEYPRDMSWTESAMYADLIAHIADHADLTEHGGSVGGSWITNDGRRLLEWVDSGRTAESRRILGGEP